MDFIIPGVMLLGCGDVFITYYLMMAAHKHGIEGKSIEANPFSRSLMGNRTPFNLILNCAVVIFIIEMGGLLQVPQVTYYILLGMYITLYIWIHIPYLVEVNKHWDYEPYWASVKANQEARRHDN